MASSQCLHFTGHRNQVKPFSNHVACLGVQYVNLPIDKVRQVTAAHMDTTSTQDDPDDEASSSSLSDPLLHLQQPLEGLHMYVCCHGSRDSRCGKLGNSLVRTLNRLIERRQLQGMIQVFKCSHVGGHKVNQSDAVLLSFFASMY